MGVRKYRGQIVCDKRWPDGTRFTRVCANRTEAKKLLDRISGAIADGSWPELKKKLQLRDREKVTLNEFAETYMEDYVKVRNKKRTWIRKRTSLNAILPWLGKMSLETISPTHLHNYVRHRKSAGAADGTINRDLATIRHLLNYAQECGIIENNPVEKFRSLKEDRKEAPRYTDEDIQAVIDAVRAECRPLFLFIRETGCRREEALSLEHWQIHEESKLVVFSENTKSRKFRYAPLTDVAFEAARTLPQLPDCPYVFYNPKSKKRWHHCRRSWEKAREQAGLPEIQVKDLRRHYAIKLAENGADMHDIQQVLGHASVATTEKHYAQFSPKHSAKKILKLLQGGKVRKKKTG